MEIQVSATPDTPRCLICQAPAHKTWAVVTLGMGDILDIPLCEKCVKNKPALDSRGWVILDDEEC